MLKKIMLMLFLLSLPAFAGIIVNGFIVGPSGVGLTGTITFTLSRSASTGACSINELVGANTTATVTLIAGAFATHPNMVPSDCLQPQQPYTVEIKDSTNKVVTRDSWWIAYTVKQSPATGNKRLHLTGLYSNGNTSIFTAYSLPQGGYKTVATATGTISGLSSKTFTVLWPQKFKDTNYAIACTTNFSAFTIASISSITPSLAVVVVSNLDNKTHSGTLNCKAWENN